MSEPSQTKLTVWGRTARVFRRLGPVGPLTLISMTLPVLVGGVMLAQITTIGLWLRSHGITGAVLFIAGYMLAAGFPILPTFAITALGGWVYGFQLGFSVCMFGYIGAMVVAYAWLHLVIGDRVVKMLRHYPKWLAVHDGLVDQSRAKTLFTIALLRLPPSVPFAVINIILVSAKVRFSDYVLGSLLGVLPRTAALVYIAASLEQLSRQSLQESQSPAWIWSGIATTVVVLVILTVMARRAINKLGNAAAKPAV